MGCGIGDQNSITIGARRSRRKGTVAKIPVGIRGQISGEALRGLWGSMESARAHLPERRLLTLRSGGNSTMVTRWLHSYGLQMSPEMRESAEAWPQNKYQDHNFLFVSATSINASLIINV